MTQGRQPYPVMRSSGSELLGHVPDHWQVTRLKTVCRLAYGESLPGEIREAGAFPVLGSNGRVGFHSRPNTRAPCIVIGRKGSFGKVTFSTVPVFAIDTTYFVDERCTSCNLRWLNYVLDWLRLDAVSRDSAIPGLAREDAYDRLVAMPPAIEQAAIARYLDHADRSIRRAIAAKQKVIELLEEQRHAIIDRAITRGLDPNVRLRSSGVEWLGHVPAHWQVARLKAVVKRVTSGSRGWSDYSADSGPLFIRIGNLTRGGLDLELDDVVRLRLPTEVLAEAKRTRILPGDVLLSITAYIGSVAVVPPSVGEAYVSQHVACCRLIPGRSNPRWVGFVLLSSVGQTHGRLTMYGGTKQGLSLDDVRNYVLLLPPIDEQDRTVEWIEARVARVNAAIANVRRVITLFREYRARLIADAVTGEVDVREAAARLPDLEAPEAIDEADETPAAMAFPSKAGLEGVEA